MLYKKYREMVMEVIKIINRDWFDVRGKESVN